MPQVRTSRTGRGVSVRNAALRDGPVGGELNHTDPGIASSRLLPEEVGIAEAIGAPVARKSLADGVQRIFELDVVLHTPQQARRAVRRARGDARSQRDGFQVIPAQVWGDCSRLDLLF